VYRMKKSSMKKIKNELTSKEPSTVSSNATQISYKKKLSLKLIYSTMIAFYRWMTTMF